MARKFHEVSPGALRLARDLCNGRFAHFWHPGMLYPVQDAHLREQAYGKGKDWKKFGRVTFAFWVAGLNLLG
jgi:hypothetical protein